MDLKIIAIKPYDGWAFVTKSKEVFLLRPPYLESSIEKVNFRDVEIAFCDHEFEIPDDEMKVSFPSWKSLFKAVRDTLISKRKAMGQAEPSYDVHRKAFLSMPPAGIKVALKIVKEEFIPGGDFDKAEHILDLLKKCKALPAHEELKQEISHLTDTVNDLKIKKSLQK